MSLTEKITKIFSLIFFVAFLSSCSEPLGCVNELEFDSEFTRVEANPTADGITGTYDDVNGGQRASWHNTGLKSNGNDFLISISGSWIPWYGDEMSDDSLEAMQVCNFCAVRKGAPNCICYDDQTSIAEIGADGSSIAADCAGSDQDNINKCTCTKNYGSASDPFAYHYPLNMYTKDVLGNEGIRIADDQSECKYTKGMGLYLGLFGRGGNAMPIRVYHLFSQNAVCDVALTNGKCLIDGKDATKYLFHSQNNRIFVKDDNAGNNGSDNNPSDDQYHERNELVKLIISDKYYSDNYGGYNVTFIRGVNNTSDADGLIEYMVRLVEDVILGPFNNDTGIREGGIIKNMFLGIVVDSGFQILLQIVLSLYISFFGLGVLIGVVELSKKELMMRLVKLILVLSFTTSTSWSLYNEIVVGFFKNGMDTVISIFTNISDSRLSPSSAIYIAQSDRVGAVTHATRFAYIDQTIKKLLSDPVAKRIFGLFFGAPFFGLIYIPIIYVLIGFFIYVVLTAAIIYLMAVMKLAFVLAIGPIFIVFSLFSQTEGMFKKWISFMGARSIEIIIIFTILYNFVMIIDTQFTTMLSYKACVERWGIPYMTIKILKSHSSASFIGWMISFVNIAALIYMMKLVVAKAPDLSGSLISIGGGGSGGSPTSAGSASSMLGGVFGAGWKAASFGLKNTAKVGGLAVAGSTWVARKTGIADKWNDLGKKIPFRGPRTRLRDRKIDSALKEARKSGMAQGLTGAALDQHTRLKAMQSLQEEMRQNPTKCRYLGLDMVNINKRFEKKLVKEPLQEFIKKRTKELKTNPGETPLFGKDLRRRVKADAAQWAKGNLVGGEDGIKSHVKDLKGFIKNRAEYSSDQAARAFGKDPEMSNQYLQHLKEQEFKREQEKQDAAKRGVFSKMANMARNAYHNLKRDTANNPKMAQENFTRKADNEKLRKDSFAGRHRIMNTGATGWNPFRKINALDKFKDTRQEAAGKANMEAMRSYLNGDGYEKEKKSISDKYDSKIKRAETRAAREKMEKKKKEKLQEAKNKKKFFVNQFDKGVKDGVKKAEKEIKDLRKNATDLRGKAADKEDKAKLNTKRLRDYKGVKKAELEKKTKAENLKLRKEAEKLRADAKMAQEEAARKDELLKQRLAEERNLAEMRAAAKLLEIASKPTREAREKALKEAGGAEAFTDGLVGGLREAVIAKETLDASTAAAPAPAAAVPAPAAAVPAPAVPGAPTVPPRPIAPTPAATAPVVPPRPTAPKPATAAPAPAPTGPVPAGPVPAPAAADPVAAAAAPKPTVPRATAPVAAAAADITPPKSSTIEAMSFDGDKKFKFSSGGDASQALLKDGPEGLLLGVSKASQDAALASLKNQLAASKASAAAQKVAFGGKAMAAQLKLEALKKEVATLKAGGATSYEAKLDLESKQKQMAHLEREASEYSASSERYDRELAQIESQIGSLFK